MTNFLFYFDEYLKNGCRDAGVELTPNRLEAKIPDCSKQNDTVASFFAGKNITAEEITTCGGFRYRATVHTRGSASEKDQESFKTLVCKGLRELGLSYRECDLRKLPTKRDTDYEVTITM